MKIKVGNYTRDYDLDSMSEFDVSFNDLQQALGRCQETLRDDNKNVIGWIFYNKGQKSLAIIADSIEKYRNRLPDLGHQWKIRRTRARIIAITVKTIDEIEIPIEVSWGLDDPIDKWKLKITKGKHAILINKLRLKPHLDFILSEAFNA